MITYTVHERDGGEGGVYERAERIVFVKEGFAWWALLFPFLWLLINRLWIALVLYMAAVVLVQGVISLAGLSEALAGWATFAMSLLVALQGNDIRRWTLARKGYRQVGLVSGRDRAECELRFFEGWLATRAARTPDRADGDRPPGNRRERLAKKPKRDTGGRDPRAGDDEVIGLFPEPGR